VSARKKKFLIRIKRISFRKNRTHQIENRDCRHKIAVAAVKITIAAVNIAIAG
jgi:hypothetical protein